MYLAVKVVSYFQSAKKKVDDGVLTLRRSGCGPAIPEDGVEVGKGPGDKRIEMREEAATQRGERIFDARGNLGVEVAVDKAVGFEVLQRRRQHLGRDVGQRAADFAEACDFVLGEDAEDEHRPLPGDAGEDVPYGARVDVGKFF